MSFSIGIVGLPNVGKSTLFKALTKKQVDAANYPFCTIDPNVGVVAVPDERLDKLAVVSRSAKIVPTTIEFIDIAGIVKGASQGEGLGNKFLSHIREVDAIVQVVRCFEDPDIHHVTGSVDPVRDIEIVLTELMIADLESLKRHHEKIGRDVKRGDKHAVMEEAILKKLEAHLNTGKPALTLNLCPEERAVSKSFFLLTDKPTIFAANVKEGDLASLNDNPQVAQVRDYARTHHGCETVVVCAQLESEIIDLAPDEATEYLKALGVVETGLSQLIHSTYHLLDLRTFFTFNETEARAWTIHAGDTAPKAAGKIHTDFEAGFIKAEVVKCEDLVKLGSVGHARETGQYRIEGKDYVVHDGDVILFKFHV